MTNIVEVSPEFKRDVKPLAKKYRTLKKSIEDLRGKIIENPYLGISYGSNMYKIRLADESKGSGKSGGFRILYYHLKKTDAGIIILLTNNKSEIGTIKKSDAIKQIAEIVKEYEQQKGSDFNAI